MKKLFFLIATAILSLSASAQFANSGSGSSSATADNEGWSTIYAEWNPMTYYYTGKGESDDTNFNAFSLGYNRAFSLSASTPIFIETGLALQYGFHKDSDDDDEYTLKYSVLSAKIPVNFMYKWSIPNSTVELIPHLGLTMRANVWGQGKEEWEDSNGKSKSEDWDIFSKKDMGKDGVWKRVQIGWQIGLKARFAQKFIIGGSYGTDFNEISKKFKFRTGTIMLGYTF